MMDRIIKQLFLFFAANFFLAEVYGNSVDCINLQANMPAVQPKNAYIDTILTAPFLFSVFFILAIFLALLAVYHIKTSNRIKKFEAENQTLSQAKKNFEAILSARNFELKSAIRKLEEGKLLSSMFLNNLTHEVRTPLNVILGFSKLLYDESLSAETRENYLDIINKKGYNLLHLINDILTTSQIDSGELEINRASCNINKLLNDLFKDLSNDERAKRNPDLKLKVIQSQSDSRCVIITDPARLEQVIWNLLDNALKFTKKGTIEFGYRIDGTQLMFFVTDTGIGIEKANIDKVFERFCKIVDNDNPTIYSGTGLGLSIAKELVTLLDGRIWVESNSNSNKDGSGTTFYFTIPYIPVKSNFTSLFSNPFIVNSNLNLKGKVILVVEDDFISYQLIETLLEKTEAKLIHVKNGEDAVEVAKLAKTLDLILMDMQLPFLSGYEASVQIKAILPNVPIVAQTAHAMNDDKARCFEAGCDGYIPKPIDPDDFMITIGKYLLGETIGKI